MSFGDSTQTFSQMFNMINHLRNNGSKVVQALNLEEDPATRSQLQQTLETLGVQDNSELDTTIEELKKGLLKKDSYDVINENDPLKEGSNNSPSRSLGQLNNSIQEGRELLLSINENETPIPNSSQGGFQRVRDDMTPSEIADDESVIAHITNSLKENPKLFNRNQFKTLPPFNPNSSFSTNDYLRVISVESNGNTNAVSNSNAHGVMQILPGTAKDIMKRTGVSYDGKEGQDFSDSEIKTLLKKDPEFNIRLGTGYLDILQDNFKDKKLALLAYNWGEGNLSKALEKTNATSYDELINSGYKIPEEARNYVPKIAGEI